MKLISGRRGSRTVKKKGAQRFQLVLEVRTEDKQKDIMAKPNYTGTFHMVEQENMEAYLEALGNPLCVFICVFNAQRTLA